MEKRTKKEEKKRKKNLCSERDLNPHMKFPDSSFNSLKVTVGTKSVTHASTHARTHPRTLKKQYAPSTFSKLGHKNWGGGVVGKGGGDRGRCERRSEGFVKNSKFWGGSVRGGGGYGFGVGIRVDVNGEVKFL